MTVRYCTNVQHRESSEICVHAQLSGVGIQPFILLNRMDDFLAVLHSKKSGG